jgi:hypothetical protein
VHRPQQLPKVVKKPMSPKGSEKSNRASAHSSQGSRHIALRQHDFDSAASRVKQAFEQAKLYEKKIENRVNYLENEEKKYLMKMLKTREKMSKI